MVGITVLVGRSLLRAPFTASIVQRCFRQAFAREPHVFNCNFSRTRSMWLEDVWVTCSLGVRSAEFMAHFGEPHVNRALKPRLQHFRAGAHSTARALVARRESLCRGRLNSILVIVISTVTGMRAITCAGQHEYQSYCAQRGIRSRCECPGYRQCE
jgi:hypothetical protein